MILNGFSLLSMPPIYDMESRKVNNLGVSFGLGEAGYDIRIKQKIHFRRALFGLVRWVEVWEPGATKPQRAFGRFALASSVERFHMRSDIVGIVHDKSTWARKSLSVFNTVIEPGWKGYLTLELVYHGNKEMIIPAGAGIAQVIFHQTFCTAAYTGKYQDQADKPVEAISSTTN